MTNEEILEALTNQLDLLAKEKKADYEQYQLKMLGTSLKDREKNGITWYPVRLESDFISTGERITLELRRTNNPLQKHAFQVGSVVAVFSGTDEKSRSLSGVISYLREDRMRVVVNQPDLPDWIKEDRIGVNLLFDDGTYREMNKALKQVISASNSRLAELRGIFYGLKTAAFSDGYAYKIPTLNSVQNDAFVLAMHAKDVAFVHGPPGTGKTTTLVHCIKEITKMEKQVLVCAPSNAAVDLLVEKLANQGLSVLRLGHPARLTPEVVENSLDVKISKHSDFGRLKEIRKKSEEYRQLAGKYKRNFGRAERSQRNMLYSEARTLRNESKDLENYITSNLVDRAEIIACTLAGASHYLVKDRLFKTVFIDESSQALEAATWIPILQAQRVIMSGDHHQLPPTIKSFEAAKAGLEDTLFSKGQKNQPTGVTMLQVQYRMHPTIMGFSSKQFYEGKLSADDSILNRSSRFTESIRMVDTAGAGFDEKVKEETLSTYNAQEADALVKLMLQDPLDGLTIGVIAPYKAQVELLTKKVNEEVALGPYRQQIDINSIDAFQGQERDVIYLSLVRSNEKGEIGFLREYKRINVALTRARERLVIVADMATIADDPFYNQLVDYVQTHGCYESVYQIEGLMNYS